MREFCSKFEESVRSLLLNLGQDLDPNLGFQDNTTLILGHVASNLTELELRATNELGFLVLPVFPVRTVVVDYGRPNESVTEDQNFLAV